MTTVVIKRFYIDNYRCFTNFEFVPGRLNLLLGPNGSGKSSLFDVTAALADIVVGGVSVGETPDGLSSPTLTRWDRRTSQRFELDIELDGSIYGYSLVVQHEPDTGRARIVSEKLIADRKTLFAFEQGNVHLHRNDGTRGTSFAFRGDRSFIAQIEERAETAALIRWREFMRHVWIGRLRASHILGTSAGEDETLTRSASNFASWYRHFSQQDPVAAQRLFTALEPVIPGFRALALPSAGSHGRVRDLVVKLDAAGTEYELGFDELSDGQRALIILYALLVGMQPGRGCLLLDEPELHVGLPELQPWLVELDARYESAGQVFVASHNPEVVDYMAAGEPFLFERPDAGPVRVRPAPFDRECGLSASQQFARGFDD
jgi:predicted ATPase